MVFLQRDLSLSRLNVTSGQPTSIQFVMVYAGYRKEVPLGPICGEVVERLYGGWPGTLRSQMYFSLRHLISYLSITEKTLISRGDILCQAALVAYCLFVSSN